MDKTFEYINNYYGKKFKAGLRAIALGKEGVLAYGDNYVYLLFGKQISAPFHPNDVELVEDNQETKIAVHEFWMSFRRRYHKVKEGHKPKLTHEEVEQLLFELWRYLP